MNDTVVKLTETVKGIEKLDQRIEKLEDLQRERDRCQDEKIAEVRSFMMKATGALAVLIPIVGLLTKLFIGI